MITIFKTSKILAVKLDDYFYCIGDILVISPDKEIDDLGVINWAQGDNKITAFEIIEPNDQYYHNTEQLVLFVFDDVAKFDIYKVIKYFKHKS